MASYRISLKEVLGGYFGSYWVAGLAGMLAFLFWPIVAFWQHLEFKPDVFAAEWIKCVTTGIVLLMIVEVLNHRRNYSSVRYQARALLSVRAIELAENLKFSIKDLLKFLGDDSRRHSLATPGDLRLRWELLLDSLKTLAADNMFSAQTAIDLRTIILDLENTRIDVLIKELPEYPAQGDENSLREMAEGLDRAEKQLQAIQELIRV